MGHNKSRSSNKNSKRRKITKGRGFAGLEYLEKKRVLATFTVTNLADGVVGAAGDLPGSLRQAVFDSNATAGADEIVFNLEDGMNFIPLTEGQLEIRDSLSITGPGPFELTISGSRAGRIFDIYYPYGPISDVTISGMTLTSGSVDGDGGAIRTSENLEVRDMILAGNSADGSGGAIAVVEELLLADQVIGIGSANLTIVDSSISGNQASNGGGVAVFSYGAHVTMMNSQVTGNAASFNGGGIAIDTFGGSSTIQDSLFAGNYAVENGGGVHLRSSSLGLNYLQNLVVSANSAGQDGGGIYVNNSEGATTVVSDTRVTGNVAGVGGGGIYSGNGTSFVGGGRTEIYQSTINDNSAGEDGGGIKAINAEGGQAE
ncbi:MAG: hypothetical protein AAF497_21425, partial [Planctomycetota bacterium]